MEPGKENAMEITRKQKRGVNLWINRLVGKPLAILLWIYIIAGTILTFAVAFILGVPTFGLVAVPVFILGLSLFWGLPLLLGKGLKGLGRLLVAWEQKPTAEEQKWRVIEFRQNQELHAESIKEATFYVARRKSAIGRF
jgi:hypothetical protein